MDEAKLRFLFGTVPEPDEVHDEFARGELLMADRPEPGTGVSARLMREAVAARILGADPTGVWPEIAQRLAAGADRHSVMDQLVAELMPLVEQAYDAYVEVVREQVHGPMGAVEAAVAQRLALDPADPVTANVTTSATESFLVDPDSPVAVLAGDVVAHIPTLTAGIVLTHHVTGDERDDAHLQLDPDLAPFARLLDVRVPGGPLHLDDDLRWGGPAGWIPETPAGSVLAVRVAESGAVSLDPVLDEPVAPPELVSLLRSVYDEEYVEPGLPVEGETLILAMLVRERDAFAQVRPPLIELAAMAGLERRGSEFAHAPEVWAQAEAFDRSARLSSRLPPDLEDAGQEALDLLDSDPRDPAELRRALELLDDSAVLIAVVEELLTPDDGTQVERVEALAGRLVTAAGRSPRAASAELMAALVAERAGRVLDAESHLRAAGHAADWPVVSDRLAWYASDRGHATEALAHWQESGLEESDPVLIVLVPALLAASAEPARNDPCWCGSGRKYKQCHRGEPPLPSMTERLAWLMSKPTAYLQRRGGDAARTVVELADILAGDDEDVMEVIGDPLITDVALAEGGWFARFLAERGPLLPADELALATSWLDTVRSVHEVVGIAYGTGVRVRDLRGGSDEVAVRDGRAARHATAGQLLCARIVPDGTGGHVFAGEVLVVARGLQAELLELIDDGDPVDLLDRLADLESLEP